MIEKEYGHYIVACDVCTNEMDATFDTWDEEKLICKTYQAIGGKNERNQTSQNDTQ